MNNNFINLLKQYTTIDTKFIETFFKKFKIGEELDFQFFKSRFRQLTLLPLGPVAQPIRFL